MDGFCWNILPIAFLKFSFSAAVIAINDFEPVVSPNMLVGFSICALDGIDGLLFAEFFAGSGVTIFGCMVRFCWNILPIAFLKIFFSAAVIAINDFEPVGSPNMLVEFSIFALDSTDGLLFAEFFAGSGVTIFGCMDAFCWKILPIAFLKFSFSSSLVSIKGFSSCTSPSMLIKVF